MLSETELDNIQDEYIHKIISSSELLLQIVNDILDFSKIEAKKLTLADEEFEMTHIFEKLSDVFGYMAHDGSTSVSTNGLFPVLVTIYCTVTGCFHSICPKLKVSLFDENRG